MFKRSKQNRCKLFLLMSFLPPGQADPAASPDHDLPLTPPATDRLYGCLGRALCRVLIERRGFHSLYSLRNFITVAKVFVFNHRIPLEDGGELSLPKPTMEWLGRRIVIRPSRSRRVSRLSRPTRLRGISCYRFPPVRFGSLTMPARCRTSFLSAC